MDHLRVAHTVSSEVKTACLARFFPPWTVRREIWTDAFKPCNSGISTDVLLFSELGHALVHHYWVFRWVSPHVSLRKDYLTRLQVFVSQASAMDRCGQRSDMGLSSPAPASSGSPRSIRQRDTGAEFPGKTRRTSSRVRPTRVQDISDGVLSPVAVSNQAPGAIIYDCRPPILPVTVRLRGLRGPCVVRLTVSSSLAAPPEEEEEDMVARASVPDPAAALTIQSILSNDPGTDENELCHFSLLQRRFLLFWSPATISDVSVPVSGTVSTSHGYFCLCNMGVPVATPGGEHVSHDLCFFRPTPCRRLFCRMHQPLHWLLRPSRLASGFGLCFTRECCRCLTPVFCLRGLSLALLSSMIVRRVRLRHLTCPRRDPLMHTWIHLLPGMFPWCWIVCRDVNTG